MFNKISNGRKCATFSHRHELGWGESTKGRGASPFLSQAAEAAMTHGKRRDIRTAISTGSHSSCRLSSSPYKFHHFPHPPPVCSPLFFHPSPIGRPHHPLPFLLFEPCPTVYKVALLNWKPQLCRCYRLSSSSLLVSFLAIEPCLLSTPPETSSSPSFGSNPVQDARGWIGCHSWHWLKVAGFIGLAPFFQLLFSTWEEAGLDQKKTWLDESIWIRSLGGKFVCLSLSRALITFSGYQRREGITIASVCFLCFVCGFLISPSSFLARLDRFRVCFSPLPFLFSSSFLPTFFFNIVMDVEQWERERERNGNVYVDFAQRLGW